MNLLVPKRFGILVTGILLAIAVLYARSLRAPRESTPLIPSPLPATDPSLGRLSPETAQALLALETREREVAESTWAVEALAALCASRFESAWDRFNASTSKWDIAESFPFHQLIPPLWLQSEPGPFHIDTFASAGSAPTLDPARWAQLLHKLQKDSWSLVQCEFRHVRFETNTAGQAALSRFEFSANLMRSSPPQRATIRGPLHVSWRPADSPTAAPDVDRIDASPLELLTRLGEPLFQPWFADKLSPPRHSLTVDPLIAQDLDHDGIPELLLVSRNVLYRRQNQGSFRSEPISSAPVLASLVHTAILGDFNGDPYPDLLCQSLRTLELIAGTPGGSFASVSQTAWKPSETLPYPMALTAGDIDQDGDWDVFLGQYKEPYEGGSNPTPFHDANDGYPSFLLLNDGHGRFSDGTQAAGLTVKRFRRVYSSSLADLDTDGDLDLLTVSDFAGLDLYRNDGKGHFTEVTSAWVANPRAFGMAHTLSDFNSDGLIDLLMIGMTSPTVERLEHLGLRRSPSPQDLAQRVDMTFGNRLYLGATPTGFQETAFGSSIARAGWAWGCAASDFDNDGFPDVAIGNGLESRESVRDYESEYWLHDQHVANSADNPVTYLYFKAKIAQTRGRGMSYGGYEKNRFFWNEKGVRFLEIGHLAGLALEEDSRNVLAEDLDADGRPDLVVLSFDRWPDAKPTLRIFRNAMPGTGHWIGFRFPDIAQPGTRALLESPSQKQTREIVAGESYRSQASGIVHFGLGSSDESPSVTVTWEPGRSTTWTNLPIDRYHLLPR